MSYGKKEETETKSDFFFLRCNNSDIAIQSDYPII